MKLHVDTVLKDYDGKPIPFEENRSLTLGLCLSNVMATAQGDPLRAYLLGKKLAEAHGEIEIEKLDYTFLKDSMTGNKQYFAIVKGQVLEMLMNAFEASEKPKVSGENK